jgi:hypothetical protein
MWSVPCRETAGAGGAIQFRRDDGFRAVGENSAQNIVAS